MASRSRRPSIGRAVLRGESTSGAERDTVRSPPRSAAHLAPMQRRPDRRVAIERDARRGAARAHRASGRFGGADARAARDRCRGGLLEARSGEVPQPIVSHRSTSGARDAELARHRCVTLARRRTRRRRQGQVLPVSPRQGRGRRRIRRRSPTAVCGSRQKASQPRDLWSVDREARRVQYVAAQRGGSGPNAEVSLYSSTTVPSRRPQRGRRTDEEAR